MTAYDTGGLDTAPARLTPRLLGLVGERFATAISAIQAELRAGGDDALAHAQAALGEMERLGVQIQQVARMVAHEGLAPQEKVELVSACRQAVAGWQARADAAGTKLRVDGAPVTVELNAAAFEQTLELVIEHGVACGESVVLGVVAPGGPAPAHVRIDITRRRDPNFNAMTATETDELLPTLASVLARGTGLLIRKTGMGNLLTLTIAVPIPMPDLPASDGEGLLPRTPVASGGRILIVDPKPSSRLKAHHLLNAAGMVVDAVENVAQAQRALQAGEPDILISGYSVQDRGMADLIDQIRSSYPSLRVIELVDQDNAFAFSLPGSDAAGKLSRNELDEHLTSAVSQEIYASKLS